MQHSQSELISASARTHFTTGVESKRSPDELLRSLESLETRKWYLQSALHAVQQGPQAISEFKSDVRKLFETLQVDMNKHQATIQKEREAELKIQEELTVVKSHAKELIQEIKTELPDVVEEHQRLEEQIAAATAERDRLLKVRKETPWYNETILMEKEAEGLEKQKQVLLSKLQLLDKHSAHT